MKTIKLSAIVIQSILVVTLMLAYSTSAYALDPDGTRYYWMEDWSNGSEQDFLEKFKTENLSTWLHSAARMDAYIVRRGSAVALQQARSANNDVWQAFKAKIPQTVWIFGMNSGLMNKSWEFATREAFIAQFSGDLGIIEVAKDAGFPKIVMFMQSPLSKGNAANFDPAQGGADLDQRVQDCLDYAKYITENATSGIDISFALIDAFPQKRNLPVAEWRKAYRDLVVGMHDAGYEYEGFIFDMKSSYVATTTKNLTDECKYIHSLANELGYPIHAGWYTWSSWTLDKEIQDRDVRNAINAIANHPDKDEVEQIWVSGNGETGYTPDYINGYPVTRQERMNEIFCTLEGIANNPTQEGDDILGPINSADVPPSEIRNLKITIDAIDQITLTWKDTYREDSFAIRRFDDISNKNDTTTLAYVGQNNTTYADNSIAVNTPYIYFIEAINKFGKTTSDEIEVTVTDYTPAAATHIKTDTSSCYKIALSWTDNADNEGLYLVVRKELGQPDSTLFTLAANETSFTDSTYQIGKAYQYNIVASNHIGNTMSAWKEAVNSECIAIPVTPDHVVIDPDYCKMTKISWSDKAINEEKTELQFKVDGGEWNSYFVYSPDTTYKIRLLDDTTYSLRIRAVNTANASAWSPVANFETFACDCQRSTYGNGGKPWETGEQIEAEFFDYCTSGQSGQEITYYEPTPDVRAGDLTIRPNEVVDLFYTTVDGQGTWGRTGAVEEGEYWEYSVNISDADSFYIKARVSSIFDDRLMNIYVDDKLTTTITYQSRPTWKEYHEVVSEVFKIDAGVKVFRIYSVTGGTDMDWFKVISANPASSRYITRKPIVIFPNPAGELVNIQLPEGRESAVAIFNLKGCVVYQASQLNGIHQITTKDFAPGVYFIQVNAGDEVFHAKLIVQ